MGGRGEAHDEDPGERIAEPRHRPAPIHLVAEAGHLLARDQLSPGDEPRAPPALDDLLMDV
jgi:hypothetical protein